MVAKSRYLKVYEQLEELSRKATLDPNEQMLVAQCLVHLNEAERGLELAGRTLAANPDDGEVAFQTAVVYALAGEVDLVLAVTRRAVRLGIQPRWFSIPMFDRLRHDPDFVAAYGRGSVGGAITSPSSSTPGPAWMFVCTFIACSPATRSRQHPTECRIQERGSFKGSMSRSLKSVEA